MSIDGIISASAVGSPAIRPTRAAPDEPMTRLAWAPPSRMFEGIEELARRINAEIAAGRMTGAAISVAAHGVVISESGFGFADKASGRAADSRTPFSLASVTKPFTTAAIMTLVQEGVMALDDPIEHYLGDALPRSVFDSNEMTVRLLGAHAAGLPSLFDMSRPNHGMPSFDRLMRKYALMAYPAGERYEYANVGYSLLGEAGSRATGLSFASFLREQIIEPMKLSDTFFSADDSRMSNAATRYDEFGVALPAYATATPPSGELYASVHDLSAFAMQMLGTPLDGADPILGQRFRTDLISPVFQGDNDAFTCFGWEGSRVAGERVITKLGGQPGASARLTLLPEQGISIALVGNRSNNHELLEELTSHIASIFIPSWTAPVLEPVRSTYNQRHLRWYDGVWTGTLIDDGVTRAVRLRIAGEDSTCMIGEEGPRPISALTASEGTLEFTSAGRISLEQSISGTDPILAFKLIEREGRLVGRCLEQTFEPAFSSLLPCIMNLVRKE